MGSLSIKRRLDWFWLRLGVIESPFVLADNTICLETPAIFQSS